MLMPNKDRLTIYEFLFKEGVLVAEKDFHPKKFHNNFDATTKIPNLHVIKAMQSLRSRGYVKEQFAWRHYYWYLTNEGIQYLRDYLHLPADIVPATLKRATKPDASRREKHDDGAPRQPREGYRREEGARQGFGRGSIKPPANQ